MDWKDSNEIFRGHVIRLLAEHRMRKHVLATKSGVSATAISDITRGTANPTVKTMQGIADAFGLPLVMMLKPLDSDEWRTVNAVLNRNRPPVPEGYDMIEYLVLPKHQIALIKAWAEQESTAKSTECDDTSNE